MNRVSAIALLTIASLATCGAIAQQSTIKAKSLSASRSAIPGCRPVNIGFLRHFERSSKFEALTSAKPQNS